LQALACLLNEVLSLNAQESPALQISQGCIFLNEVLSLNAQESWRGVAVAVASAVFLNEVLSLNAQE